VATTNYDVFLASINLNIHAIDSKNIGDILFL